MSVNTVILIGNLGADPEIKKTESTTIANFSIATTEKYKDTEVTSWHRCVAFGKLADIVEMFLVKGKQVYVSGRIQYREWEDDQGNKRLSTDIIVNNMQMLGKKEDAPF